MGGIWEVIGGYLGGSLGGIWEVFPEVFFNLLNPVLSGTGAEQCFSFILLVFLFFCFVFPWICTGE